MDTPDFQTMELKKLHQYVLANRNNDEAFHAYVDRSRAAGRTIVINPTDPNWEEKMIRETEKRVFEDTDS